MKISEIVQSLPDKIGAFELITTEGIDAELNVEALRHFFSFIKQGELIEDLSSYVNHSYRYALRVRGRGDKFSIYFEFMQIIYKNDIPVNVVFLKEYRYIGKVEEIFQHFIKWIEIHAIEKNQ